MEISRAKIHTQTFCNIQNTHFFCGQIVLVFSSWLSATGGDLTCGENPGWGFLAPFESYGKAGDVKDDFIILTKEEACSEKYKELKHASHTMIIARQNDILWEQYKIRAAVMVGILIRQVH